MAKNSQYVLYFHNALQPCRGKFTYLLRLRGTAELIVG